LGSKLKLGNNALGAVFAVIGTSLPETIVPLVAILGAMFFKTDINISSDIAQGAIIGSPFILSTLALFLLFVTLIILFLYKKRKKPELIINCKNVLREYRYFIIAYSSAIIASFFPFRELKIVVAFLLIIFYLVFVYRTILYSRHGFCESEIDELIFEKILKLKSEIKPETKKASFPLILLQIFISLVCLILFSHLFVNEIKYFSLLFNLNPILLSLFITPIATELPEIVNSIIWAKNNKDDLAISNILGAIVFQAMIPTSIGIILTSWVLDKVLIINSILVLMCTLFLYCSIIIYKRFKLEMLFLAGIFYFIYIFIVKLI